MWQVAFERPRALRLLIAVVAVFAAFPSFGTNLPVSAQGTATVEITNIDAGTGLPAPFTRFQVTSENGTVYGPMETDLNGYVSFAVTVDPQGTSFTVIEETPPACASVPEPQITDPLLAGETASLSFFTQDYPGCGLGAIALYAMACPDGFAAPADDYAPWRDGCTGTTDGVEFTITSVETGESWNPVAGAYGIPGRAPIVGLPAGDYAIQQIGDAPASVFCLQYETANYATSPEPSAVVPVSMNNGIGTVSLSGNRLSCDFFTSPGGVVQIEPTTAVVEPAAVASLEVHLAECPSGYVPTETIYDDCHGNGLSGIPVQLSGGNGFSGTLATTLPESPGPGVASFVDLGAGTYTVGAVLPADVSILTYCSDDGFVEIPSVFDEASRTQTLDLSAGQVVTCDWYVIPNDVEPAIGTSSLEMHALRCPNGTDPNSALYDLCHGNGADGVVFSVTGPNGYSTQATTSLPTSPGPGIATFIDLFEGAHTVTIEGFGPTTSIIPYCSLADADTTVPFSSIDADTISLELPAETGIVCDWYVIPPADAYTTLQVTRYQCPFNMVADETTPRSDFLSLCSPSTGTTQFTLTPEGAEPVTLTTGSSGVGTVLFESLPSNTYQLVSNIPGHSNPAYVYCGVEGTELPFVGITSVSFDIDATAGSYLCQWFNVPENLSGYSDTVTVTNFLCPPGTTGDFASRCGTAPLAGATLLLARSGSTELEAVTDAAGVASFERLMPGDYQLTNVPPAGTNIAVYVVSCVADGQTFAFSYEDQQSMSIALELPGGADIDCAWYNVPPGAPTVIPGERAGSIVVYKFLCQGKSISQYNWEKDCVAEAAPVTFALATSEGSPVAVGATDANGVLAFTNLANGAYHLDETSGNWCHAEADLVDSAGNVLIRNGGANNVFIYNCSVQNVNNLPSTGTGQTGAVARSGFDDGTGWQLLFGAIATLGIALVVRHGLHQAVAQATDSSDDPARASRNEEPVA